MKIGLCKKLLENRNELELILLLFGLIENCISETNLKKNCIPSHQETFNSLN